MDVDILKSTFHVPLADEKLIFHRLFPDTTHVALKMTIDKCRYYFNGRAHYRLFC